MTKYFIDQANESDLLLVHSLQKIVHDYPWTYENLLSTYGSGHSSIWMICENAREIIGYVIIQSTPDVYELLDIGIHPLHQNKGHGKRLFTYAAEQMTENLSWFLEVRASNKVAQKLYVSLGFVEVTTRENYYQTKKGSEDAIVLARAPYCSSIT